MREKDIRPRELLNEYLRLSEQDATTLFADGARDVVPCVACDSGNVLPAFEKNGFGYSRCSDCGTLFQTPRPQLAVFEQFYVNSESSDFWAKTFFPQVAEARRTAVFAPRAAELAKMLKDRGFEPRTVVDVGAGHGMFLSELVGRLEGASGIAVEPSSEMIESCRKLGFEVREALAEDVKDLDGRGDLVCSLEVMEHVHNPLRFISNLAAFTAPGGWVFFTTLGADGFDITVLGEHANAVFPPHHLNFMSVEGFDILCRRAGLTDVEVLTPGKLDVDIVRNKLSELPELLDSQPFIKALLNDDTTAAAFQQFLAQNRLSSHTWVLARKPA
ncbi:class I SAM-dependent methyltransferase [Devosia sp. J2-20]|jgi:SAM-dependent methyltransferase|uniref:class I SAM-dependent methyltransferase n=1 Tax=Devosia sp. J2-20 TaxID=3026161 RepID=UPI00249A305C|nr:class I SAM-dependent methyltransferase [Devosia sp. J2-20]WDR00476.1 class I SAM-dependent methyltransferase [Devosia sp. J2-20]|tara:strand:- start:611 stop:1600 length:990 start_codon:yes stop_codon:yes gene_type:complete